MIKFIFFIFCKRMSEYGMLKTDDEDVVIIGFLEDTLNLVFDVRFFSMVLFIFLERCLYFFANAANVFSFISRSMLLNSTFSLLLPKSRVNLH